MESISWVSTTLLSFFFIAYSSGYREIIPKRGKIC